MHIDMQLMPPSKQLIKNMQNEIRNKYIELKYRISSYFSKNTYQKYIALYDTWPDINNAEKECLFRFKKACEKINVGFFTITNDGIINNKCPLKNIHINNIPRNKLSCIISLHFSSPKNTKHYTLMALWNPIAFHKNKNDIYNVCLSDGFISCHSDKVDNYFTSIRKKPIIGYLNHSLSDPILELSINSSLKCFYIGINWEKCNSSLTPERKNILNILNKLENLNLLSIYGPKIFQGVEVWKGYKSYKCEIPFDGISVIHEIRRCGICLVFSSDSHINSQICSMRLFEGLAAGVPLICDNHPFIQKWFGDNVFYVNKGDNNCVDEIVKYIGYIKNNPDIILKKMENCRKIFLDNFLLDNQLSILLTQIDNYRK